MEPNSADFAIAHRMRGKRVFGFEVQVVEIVCMEFN